MIARYLITFTAGLTFSIIPFISSMQQKKKLTVESRMSEFLKQPSKWSYHKLFEGFEKEEEAVEQLTRNLIAHDKTHVNSYDIFGMALIHIGAVLNNCLCITQLIEAGADVHCRVIKGCPNKEILNLSAIEIAVKKGFLNVVKLLLSNGADVNSVDSAGRSLLHRAAEAGYVEIAEQLIIYGARSCLRDKKGDTAALCALRQYLQTQKETYRDLIGLGEKCHRTLGFDGDLQDSSGQSFLDLALEADRSDLVDYFLEHGAGLCSACVKPGLITYDSEGERDAINELLAGGHSIDPKEGGRQKVKWVLYCMSRMYYISDEDGDSEGDEQDPMRTVICQSIFIPEISDEDIVAMHDRLTWAYFCLKGYFKRDITRKIFEMLDDRTVLIIASLQYESKCCFFAKLSRAIANSPRMKSVAQNLIYEATVKKLEYLLEGSEFFAATSVRTECAEQICENIKNALKPNDSARSEHN